MKYKIWVVLMLASFAASAEEIKGNTSAQFRTQDSPADTWILSEEPYKPLTTWKKLQFASSVFTNPSNVKGVEFLYGFDTTQKNVDLIAADLDSNDWALAVLDNQSGVAQQVKANLANKEQLLGAIAILKSHGKTVQIMTTKNKLSGEAALDAWYR